MKKFALIGKKLDYSFSKIIHDYLIKEFNVNATYELIETDFFSKELVQQFDGVNVTNPYKQEVVKYYNDNSDIGVCNVVYNNNGYNVDIDGFMYLYNKLSNVKKTVVLGNGACAKLIKNNVANVEIVETLHQEIPNVEGDLLVNATPVGMNSYESIVSEDIIKNFMYVIDLNYNPLNSKLKYLCYKNNVKYIGGIEMLVVQAIKTFEIFNNVKVNEIYIQKVLIHILNELKLNIAIIGMPLAGKSTICKKYNGIDIDEQIRESFVLEELIKDESEFRKVETATIRNNLDKKLICFGGGAIKTSENLELLKNHLILFLDEELSILKSRFKPDLRPLLKTIDDVDKTYYERIDFYNNFCNIKLSYSEMEEFLNGYFNN